MDRVKNSAKIPPVRNYTRTKRKTLFMNGPEK